MKIIGRGGYLGRVGDIKRSEWRTVVVGKSAVDPDKLRKIVGKAQTKTRAGVVALVHGCAKHPWINRRVVFIINVLTTHTDTHSMSRQRENPIRCEQYQLIGVKCYKQKEYNRAVSAFTTALDFAGRDTLLELLDQRAATYMKLDNFNSAIKDGRTMIQSFKTEVKVVLYCLTVITWVLMWVGLFANCGHFGKDGQA